MILLVNSSTNKFWKCNETQTWVSGQKSLTLTELTCLLNSCHTPYIARKIQRNLKCESFNESFNVHFQINCSQALSYNPSQNSLRLI